MTLPIRRLTIGKDKWIKISKDNEDKNSEVELNEEDKNRIMRYRARDQIIKFLKYNDAFILSFRPKELDIIREVLNDFQLIGSGIITTEDMKDEVISFQNPDRKILIKKIVVRLSVRLEK